MNKLQVSITGGREDILGQVIEVETAEIRFEVGSVHVAEAIGRYYADEEELRYRILELTPEGDIFSTSKWAELQDLKTSDRFVIGTQYLIRVFAPVEARDSNLPKILENLIFDECTDDLLNISFEESDKYIRNPEEIPRYVRFYDELDLRAGWTFYKNGKWNERCRRVPGYSFFRGY